MNGRITIVAILSLSLAGTAAAQEKFTLKQTIEPGKYQFTRSVKEKRVTTTLLPGQPGQTAEANTSLNMSGEMALEAQEKDGVKKGSFVYRRIAFEVIAGPNVLRYDSDDSNASGILVEAMKTLAGVTFTFDLIADGNVRNVKGKQPTWNEFWKSKVGMDPIVFPHLYTAITMYVVPNVRISDYLWSGFLPRGPVAVGDRWNPNAPSDPNDPVSASTTRDSSYTLASIEGGVGGKARIEYEGKSRLNKPVEDMGGTAEKREFTAKAVYVFDMAKNLIVSNKISGHQEYVFVFPMRDGPNTRSLVTRDYNDEIGLTPVKSATSAPGTGK